VSGSMRSPWPRELPRLIDCRGIMEELGVRRGSAEAIMRHLPKVEVEGLRKVFVRREDVRRYLDDHTRTG
jgi:hypothetical protein